MNKKKQILKGLFVDVLVVSLLQMQLNSVAFAQSASSTDDIINGVNQATQVLGQAANTYLQGKQQVAQSTIAAMSAASYMPKTSASKYFPECQLPQSMSSVPQNNCSVTANANMVTTLDKNAAVADQMMNYYDQMMNEATQTSSTGVKCLTDKKKALDSQLTEMVNNLTRLQTQLKQESEAFREKNKALIASIEEDNALLFGSTGSATLNSKTRDFSKLISKSCQGVLGDDMKSATSVGLSGLLSSTTGKNKSAYDYNASRSQIESEIRSEVVKIQNNISTSGITNWVSEVGQSGADTTYASLKSKVAKEVSTLKTQAQRISSEFQSLGVDYTLPAMDKNMSSDLSSFISNASSYFSNNYVQKCMESSKEGVSIDIDKILSGITQTRTGNSSAANSYRDAVRSILAGTSDTMEQKLAKIKDLEATKYEGIVYSYTNASGITVTESPYSLLNKEYTACSSKYTEGKSTANSTSSTISQKAKAARATSLLTEYKNLADNFSSKLSNDALTTILNCDGESLKSSDTCNESTMSAKSEGFCMAKATSCANNILSCYSELDGKVTAKKTSMTNTAKQFNANVQTMVNSANTLLKNQMSGITQLTKVIQSRFPGTNFKIPTDLYVTLPETSKKTFGVDLAADGDINKFLTELPTKIEALKKVFEDQKTAVDQEVDDYIAKQKAAMETNKSKWEKVKTTCQDAAKQSRTQIAAANAKTTEANAKIDQNINDYCTKYSEFATNPNGACDDVSDLYTSANKIASYINKSARDLVYEMKAVCKSSNNESNIGAILNNLCTQEDYPDAKERQSCLNTRRAALNSQNKGKKSSNTPKVKLNSLCKTQDKSKSTDENDAAFVKKVYSDLGIKDAPSDEQITLIINNLKGTTDKDLPESAPSFFKNLAGEVSFKNDDQTKSICNQLQSSSVASVTNQSEIDEYNKVTNLPDTLKSQKAALEKKVETASAEYKSAKTDIVMEAKKKAEKEAKDELDALNTKIAEAESAASTYKTNHQKPNEKKGEVKISDAILSSYADTSTSQTSEDKLTELGEKMSNTACAATNNTTSTSKNPFEYNLDAFDKSNSSGTSK